MQDQNNQDKQFLAREISKDFKGVWVPHYVHNILAPDFDLIFNVVNFYYNISDLSLEQWEQLYHYGLAEKISKDFYRLTPKCIESFDICEKEAHNV